MREIPKILNGLLPFGEWGTDMKKYKRIIVVVTMLYAVTAILLYLSIQNSNKRQADYYRVEINRFMADIMQSNNYGQQYIKDLISDSQYIKDISYIKADETDNQSIVEFYSAVNGYSMEIVPIQNNNKIDGYIRFDYQKKYDTKSNLIVSETALFAIFLLSFSVLLYTYFRIITPFNKLLKMPYELSRGNLEENIKESKSKFFGKFIWGINMLKDVLDNHKNQELKLTRDKKMILLTISHDIKTPINAINLYAKAIERGMYTTQKEYIEAAVNIQKKTAEIDNFVTEIVKTSTQELISIEVKNSEFYLKDLVDKIQDAYAEKCRIQKLDFIIGSYENVLIKGDIDRIYEAFGNIMENAIKYGDGKMLKVTFSEEDYCVLISIYNSGEAVEEKDMVHLFDSFYRGNNTDGKKGNGLGLYICHEIMKKSGGDIYAIRHEEGMEFVLVNKKS